MKAAHPPRLDEWLCIHPHEVGWSNHDTGRNGHDGGLQMSFDFMQGYGRELFRVRGFQPWPATARMCALL